MVKFPDPCCKNKLSYKKTLDAAVLFAKSCAKDNFRVY